MDSMRSLPVLLVVSFLALPLSAFEVDPVTPTTATPVTLTVHEFASCPPPPEVTRAGNTFNLLLKPGPCLSPPTFVTFTVQLGKLAPGDYEIVVTEPFANDVQRVDYGAFFVRDAGATLFVLSPPVGPTSGGTEVFLSAAAEDCHSPNFDQCPVPAVSFNGIPATVEKEKFAAGTLAVIAPPNAKGIADVVVVGTHRTQSGRVFRYYDPSDAPLPTMFARVLVPVWFSGVGAFGSSWATEVTVLDASNYDFEPYRRPRVVHRATTALDFGASRAGGVLFFPPRDLSPAPRFGSLVRDTSRQADDWGTEVRVVRESDFRTAEFSLLNIPADSRFRQSLRIFDADSVEANVQVSVFAMDGTFLAGKSVLLHSANPCNRYEPCASDDPAYAMVDLTALFPEVAGQQRVRVSLSSIYPDRLWAFVTVTNNQTQHVTVIAPQ
jgi:hypothetical protein